MNEEYIYDIGKYTIGVDKNGEDGIGLTVAIINDNGEIHLLGNCYGNNARCIDLLIKENQQLKENNQSMQEEMARTWAKLQQKEDIIYKIKKCIEEKEEYYGDYMGDGNYTMYSMMGANNNRIPYIKSNLIKQILDNKGDENDG